MSNTDEILKFKKLLDDNIITQEEYEKKKEELLNLHENNSDNIINDVAKENTTNDNKWILFLICLFLGILGIHKFYQGKIIIGIIYLFTGGLFGIGWIVDIISIFISCLEK